MRSARILLQSALVAMLLITTACAQSVSYRAPETPVPPGYFGLHAMYPTSPNRYSWPGEHVPFGSFRTWDDLDGTTWPYIQRVGLMQIESIRRAGNFVTVTTADFHGMIKNATITVVLSGVADPSFNGTFSVAQVTGTKSFRFQQNGPDASSHGGTELASDWTQLDAVVAKAQSGNKEVLYTFGNTPIWATSVQPPTYRVATMTADGDTYFTIATETPMQLQFNKHSPQLVLLAGTGDVRLDGLYHVRAVTDAQHFKIQNKIHDLPQRIDGGTVRFYENGGGVDLGGVGNTPVRVGPATAMEPDAALFRNFVEQVVKRYCGCDAQSHPTARIRQYEVWNEPNLSGEGGDGTTFFVPASGRSDADTSSAMVGISRIVYETVKRMDKSALVVSPSATGHNDTGPQWVNQFLAKGGAKYFDVLGYHFYTGTKPPEYMAELITSVRQVLAKNHVDKPLWNTEVGYGWPNSQPMPQQDQAAGFVARAYLLNWAAGAARVYWFQWDNQCWVKLRLTTSETPASGCGRPQDITGVSAAGIAYGQVNNWLVGSTEHGCAKRDNVWTCSLTKPDKTRAWAVWTEDGTKTFAMQPEWHASSVRDLRGNIRKLDGGTLTIGPAPVLVESSGFSR